MRFHVTQPLLLYSSIPDNYQRIYVFQGYQREKEKREDASRVLQEFKQEFNK